MFNDMILDKETKKRLQLFVAVDVPRCLILSGNKHMGKATAARRIAEHFLGEGIDFHPDFMLLEPQDGTVRIEQIRDMISKAHLMPVKSDRQVFIIDDADTMSVSAQNALLKLIEDDNIRNTVIFISNGGLLPTIKSRCTQIDFFACRMHTDDAVLDLLADGCPGIPILYKDTDFLKHIKECVSILNSSPRDILKVTHALKEKDKDFFYEKYTKEEIFLFTQFLKSYYESALIEQLEISKSRVPADGICKRNDISRICELALIAKNQCQIKNYSKNDFVNFLFELALS